MQDHCSTTDGLDLCHHLVHTSRCPAFVCYSTVFSQNYEYSEIACMMVGEELLAFLVWGTIIFILVEAYSLVSYHIVSKNFKG